MVWLGSDGEVVAAFASALADIVSTKRPSVPLWQSRAVVAEALRALHVGSRALPAASSRGVAGALIPALVAGIAKEVGVARVSIADWGTRPRCGLSSLAPLTRHPTPVA